MPFFKKKPVVIEARQLKTDNIEEIANWCTGGWTESVIFIPTLEGIMTAQINDWIIKGVNDEFYPCKPDIFEKTYESVDE